MKGNQNNKIQEMQIMEQNLQNILLQKQAFQMELTETQNALEELGKSEGDVFKIVGQLMLKAEKSKMKEELENKQKIVELRLKTIERQENSFMENLGKLREEFLGKEK